METKICSKCNEEKELKEYSKSKLGKNGLRSSCKKCESIKRKEYYKKNKEKELKNNKEWCLKNNEQRSKKQKDNYYKNRDYYIKKNKDWYLKNKTKRRKSKNNNRQARLKKDKTFKLLEYNRNRINSVIKNNKKSKTTEKLLDCTIEYFKNWLESQFDNKMTWDNYGTYWHVDHILPCATFDLRHSEEQEICFHHTNLRPLEATKNLIKGAKII